MRKLQTDGGRRERKVARFSGVRRRSEEFAESPQAAMSSSYERARECEFLPLASRFSISIAIVAAAQAPENFSLLSTLIYLLMQLDKVTIAFYRF